MGGSVAVDQLPVNTSQKCKYFFATHWRGFVTFAAPIIFIPVLTPFPAQAKSVCAYVLCVMAAYWVSECIPLAVTAFVPVIMFPFTGAMTTNDVSKTYMNDTIMMFLGSLILAASVEQSGLHKRIALRAINCIGYSHTRMLFAIAFVTMFVSMWITNTAAATMMVPITFALLEVYKGQGLYKIYEKNKDTGEEQSTMITSCYFCCIAYAATIGGIGTLVGTVTNLVFKGLFTKKYNTAPDYLNFLTYSGFAIPLMLLLNLFMYLYIAVVYFGLFRSKSAAAKSVELTAAGAERAKRQVAQDIKNLGPVTCHEKMVILLFGGAMILFFTRSPKVFHGWGDAMETTYGTPTFIKDSAVATFFIFLMTFLPKSCEIFKNCKATYEDELPKTIPSVLDWKLMNRTLPWSFAFLLGGGFALSACATATGLSASIADVLHGLKHAPNAVVLLLIIVFTVFVTNFASNVAVCNVITPIAMELAIKLSVNPLWYCLASGIASSFAFMFPVGTPGNLIVQSAAKIPTRHMIRAGVGPTITTIILTWVFIYIYAPVIWTDLHSTSLSWTGAAA